MDTKGNIRELKPGESPRPNEIPLDKKPNPKCKDCYGRGFVRYIVKNIAETVPCHCTKLGKKEGLTNV